MKNKLTITIFFLFFLPALSVSAQYHFEKADAWLSANVADMGGRALLVVYKDGKVIYTGTQTQMNMREKMVARMVARRNGGTANTGDYTVSARQPIASCSKWLSAALVMTFVDEGKLKLSDTVGKYLPMLSANGKGNITIDECLSHRTAINAPSLRESMNEMKDMQSMDAAIAAIAAMPMEGKPGTIFRYSNVGLQIAGAVLEKISGKSFETLFSERIAGPLQMKNTDFGKGPVALPAGGADSTPEDYLDFLVTILNKGVFNGKRILSEKSIGEMQVDRITSDVHIAYSPAEAGDLGYGYGEWVDKNATLAHPTVKASSPGLFGSVPLIDNNRHYAAFLMTFYLKTENRSERYEELKKILDEAVN
jgi:CubicO group peptidase (beta-lactamase class C family)